jgi:hypothetical protein
VDVDGREKTRVHHNFAPICYSLGTMELGGKTFAPHVWHFGVN